MMHELPRFIIFHVDFFQRKYRVCVCVCTFNIVKEDDSLYTFAVQVLESYDRAYINMVRVQQLSELEEVCSDA